MKFYTAVKCQMLDQNICQLLDKHPKDDCENTLYPKIVELQ